MSNDEDETRRSQRHPNFDWQPPEPPYPQPLRYPSESPAETSWVDRLGSPSEGAGRLTAQEMKAVYNLIERLPWNSRVRPIAEALLNQPNRPLESLQPLIQALIRPNRVRWQERQLAAWVLGRAPLNDEQRAFAAETLTQLLERRLEVDSFVTRRHAFGITLPLGVLSILMVSGSTDVPFYFPFFLTLGTMFPMTYLSLDTLTEWQSVQVRASAATALGHLGEPSSLDVLTTALTASGGLISQRLVRESAAVALPAVLASLTTEHYGMVRAETMKTLCRALNHPNDGLVIAILDAFTYIGDQSTLSPVQKFANGQGRAARDNRIRDAARRCLPSIENRIAQQNQPEMLLRASAPPTTPPEQLLRPAAGSGITDPLELLRAATAPGTPLLDRESELILAILTDLERSGDTRALSYVEQIAANQATPLLLRQAAQRCLPSLRARAEIAYITQRPSTE